ncbi:HAMP domain-containing histidine kinase [Streptomyces sp. ventii]|uniref:histidine kinase n=1 Tax=Streptomyces spiramenti TaxID=2720606 RepID=A0ABX1AIG2_9ACTN|nr:HAMP domain-containing histidine kinase [Streptomyces spiramenti]
MLGLRGKLALSVAAVAALVAAVIGVLVHEQTSRTQLDTARRDLDASLLAAVADYERMIDGGVLVNPPELPQLLRDTIETRPVRATLLDHSDGEPVLWAALLERPSPVPPPDDAAAPVDSAPGAAEGPATVLAVRQSYLPQTEALGALDRTLLGAGLIATGLGSLLGLLLATVGGRRIAGSARTAQRIAQGDLAARVRPRGRDEIARMATAVNTMADALQVRLEAERRITADIAHELRTPVAGLVTAAELLPPGRPTELVRDRARTLRRLVEDVLEVARLDTAGVEEAEFECCLTSELARQAVAACADQLPEAAGGESITLTVTADAEVRTDPRRVARVLANLLSNALRHGGAPVGLEVDGPLLRVRDDGPGFPVELLAQGPQRFRTAARERGRGTGLGLTIVAGQARLLGARVHRANPLGGGAVTELLLPTGSPGSGGSGRSGPGSSGGGLSAVSGAPTAG